MSLLLLFRPSTDPGGTIELTPTPVVLDLGVFAPTLDLSLALTPTPVVLDLAVPAPTLPLTLALTPTPVVLDLGVFAPTISTSLTLSPAPVVLDLSVAVPTLSSFLSLAPAPVVLDLGVLGGLVGVGALTLTPTPVVLDLVVPEHTVGAPVDCLDLVVSGSDHQFICDSLEFYAEYDTLTNDTDRMALLSRFLLLHGGKLRLVDGFWVVRGGAMPTRYP